MFLFFTSFLIYYSITKVLLLPLLSYFYLVNEGLLIIKQLICQ
ncbi:MAG: hypothetical protein H6Q42_979 [Deltaproteobacteria bacterium]|nr:hypothetical protein [Deltaproteobacteria bacterium]